MSASVPACMAVIASPLARRPSTTFTYATTPRNWSYSESKISARAGAAVSPSGRADARDDRLQQLGDPLPRLGGDLDHAVGVVADQLADLARHPLGLGAG